MSWQTAESFLELFAADRNLQTHQKLADAWTIPTLTRFARGKGFIVSETDLKIALESFSHCGSERVGKVSWSILSAFNPA